MPNTYKVEATEYDNRSGEGPGGVMFGFVYFNDDTRLAYTSMDGVLPDVTGGWPEVTPTHAKVAKEFLDNEVPGWYTPAE